MNFEQIRDYSFMALQASKQNKLQLVAAELNQHGTIPIAQHITFSSLVDTNTKNDKLKGPFTGQL